MMRLPRLRLPRRKGTPPPGIWLGRPHVGAKWRTEGATYVLVSYQIDFDGHIRLEYAAKGSALYGSVFIR